MRRSICYAEPKLARAGESKTWKFIYIPSSTLPKGTTILIDLAIQNKQSEWTIPSAKTKEEHNAIWAEYNNGKVMKATQVSTQGGLAHFEVTLPTEIKEEQEIAFFIGSRDKSKENSQSVMQHFTERRKPVYFYVDTKGKSEYKDPEVLHMDVRGNKLDHIKIVAPSIVKKNERFDILVRFEDAFNNLTGFSGQETLVEITHDQLRNNLSWKLFVPETGFIALPNLYFNEPGVFTFKLKNLATGDTFFSSPIQCYSKIDYHVYWGSLHEESPRYDCKDDAESALRYFRDDQCLQFFATSSFDTAQETSIEQWKNISAQVTDFNEEDRFTTMLGINWMGSAPSEGLRHLIYFKDNKPLLRRKDTKSNSLKKIYKTHTSKEILSIPSMTMANGIHFNFENFSPDHERVVEIYNSWGSSECLAKDGNTRPITSTKNYTENSDGSIRSALNKGCRFGFCAGGFDDRGIYRALYDSDQKQYSAGRTAILAPTHSRDMLMQALHARRCYATTGHHIVINITIASTPMGGEVTIIEKPGLAYNRHIKADISGTSDIAEILIVRNGEPLAKEMPMKAQYTLAFDDMTDIHSIAIKNDNQTPFVYYYLRITQKDGHIAWTSPIWIDIPEVEEE